MDTVRRRRCETCAFHQAGPTPCTGICLNIDWQPRTDATRFVRDRELACYGGWGIDHWRPKQNDGPLGGFGGANAGSGGPGGSGGANSYRGLVGAPSIRLTPATDAGTLGEAESATDQVSSIVWHEEERPHP
jgi:hypothetical protein